MNQSLFKKFFLVSAAILISASFSTSVKAVQLACGDTSWVINASNADIGFDGYCREGAQTANGKWKGGWMLLEGGVDNGKSPLSDSDINRISNNIKRDEEKKVRADNTCLPQCPNMTVAISVSTPTDYQCWNYNTGLGINNRHGARIRADATITATCSATETSFGVPSTPAELANTSGMSTQYNFTINVAAKAAAIDAALANYPNTSAGTTADFFTDISYQGTPLAHPYIIFEKVAPFGIEFLTTVLGLGNVQPILYFRPLDHITFAGTGVTSSGVYRAGVWADVKNKGQVSFTGLGPAMAPGATETGAGTTPPVPPPIVTNPPVSTTTPPGTSTKGSGKQYVVTGGCRATFNQGTEECVKVVAKIWNDNRTKLDKQLTEEATKNLGNLRGSTLENSLNEQINQTPHPEFDKSTNQFSSDTFIWNISSERGPCTGCPNDLQERGKEACEQSLKEKLSHITVPGPCGFTASSTGGGPTSCESC